MPIRMQPGAVLAEDLKRASAGMIEAEVNRLQRRASLAVLGACVRRTPSDLGAARNNWQVGVDFVPAGVVPASSPDPVTAAASAIATAPAYSVTWIVNNVPYIGVLDEGGFVPPNPGPSKDRRPSRRGRILVRDGYSTQAPEGIVDGAIEEARLA